MLLLEDGTTHDDPFVRGGFEEGAALPEADALLVPLERLDEARSAGASRLGVEVPSTTEPEAFAQALPDLSVVAVRMETAGDGRAFTLGRWLRERHGFTGQIRITGPFVEDQLDYLRRCGFDAYELGEEHDPEVARSCLHRFSQVYQRPVPTPGSAGHAAGS